MELICLQIDFARQKESVAYVKRYAEIFFEVRKMLQTHKKHNKKEWKGL